VIHGSLFSGIGGFDLGFERAGIRTVWQVEIDAHCRKVLARHFPDAQRFEDVRECCGIDCLDPGRWRDGEPPCERKHYLRPVDIISGGFPCQDISNAGKRAGIDGERSGLWSEYARIIRELRPRFVVVENVAALLGRGMERVLGDLAACGYDAEWDCIPASSFGAPHSRDRVWIVAYPKQGRLSTDLLESRRAFMQGAEGAKKFWKRRGLHEPAGQSGVWVDAAPETRVAADAWTDAPCEPLILGIPDGISGRVDRLRGLGNAIVPQIAEWIGRRIVECDRMRSN
jgi:DNA (cytosine-5)-methyltransferase 1